MNVFLPQYKNSIITVTPKTKPEGIQYAGREKYAYKLLPDLVGREKINIGEFSGCFLEQAVIPAHIKKLEAGVFLNCAYLEYVEIPEGITSIPIGAFFGCSRLKKVRLPESLEEIGDYGFYQCRNLEQIVLPKALKKIGKQAFSGCTHLEYVVGGEECQKGEGAFEKCFSLIKKPEAIAEYKDKFTYEVDRGQGKVKITKYIGNDTNVTIPEWIEKYPVKKLGDGAFANCHQLVSVNLPNSLEILGEDLFSGCSALKEVNMPEVFGTKEIPNCKGFENIEAYSICAKENDTVDFQDLTVSIAYGKKDKFVFRHRESGEIAFKNAAFTDPCVGTVKEGRVLVYRGRSISLPKGMFKGCKSLQQLTFSSYVAAIGEEVFSGCESLEKVVLPNGLKSLPARSFEGCIKLTGIQGAEELESIGESAFCGCRAFDYAGLPVTIREIGSNAFSGCHAIRFLKIFSQVERIGEKAFFECGNMKSLLLFPEKLQIMGEAFGNCKKLKCVKVPTDCSRIEESAFAGCEGLKEIILPAGTAEIKMANLLYSKGFVNVIIKTDVLPKVQQEAYKSLEDVNLFLKPHLLLEAKAAWTDKIPYKSLEAGVFSDFYSYEQIEDKDEIKIIQYLAAGERVKVPEVIEGLPVTVIGRGAFENHKETEEIILPDTIEEIQEKAFAGCEKLSYFILPKKVTSLGKEAFFMCSGLRGITFLSSEAAYGMEEFSTCGQLRFITVGKETKGADPKWEAREKFQIEIEDNQAVITDYAGMKEDEPITEKRSVFIPEIMDGYPVRQIGRDIQEQDEYVQKGVFAGCEEIEEIHFPVSVKKIGVGTFYHCTSLKHLKLPKAIQQLGKDCFRECTGLISVNMQAEEIEIGEKAFYGCRRLEAVAIWAKMVRAASGCFDDCEMLEDLFFHSSGEIQFPDNAKGGLGRKKLVMAGLGEPDEKFSCQYEINHEEQTISIVKYTGEEEKVNVPGFLAGLPVAEIKEEAFMNQSALVQVDISSMIQKIGQGAFKGCSSLKQASLPEGLKTVEKELFFMCVLLERVVLPSALTEIGEKAFSGCALTEIELPENLKNIEMGAFKQCMDLRRILFSKALKTIKTEAFSGCVKLRHVMLPAGISVLMENTFKDCKGLKSLLFRNPACEKKQGAFLGCSLEMESSCERLPEKIEKDFLYKIDEASGEATVIGIQEEKEEITIPDYVDGIPVTAVADIAFAWKKQMKRVMLPENIQVIGSMAFYGCENLEEVVFFHKAEGPRICKEAFFALKKAVIYFMSKESMEALKAENSTCPLFCTEGSCDPNEAFTYIFHRERGELCIQASESSAPCEESWWTVKPEEEREKKRDRDIGQYPWEPIRDRIKKVTLGEKITCVESRAFEACTNLQEVHLPDSLLRIGQAAFKNCISLGNILLPENLESIGAEAFYGCHSLKGKKESVFLLPDSLIRIERRAFYGCKGLEYLVLPGSIGELGMGAFQSCSRLGDIYMEHLEKPDRIGREAFYGVAEECEISVKFSDVSMLETKFDGKLMIHTPLTGACGKGEDGQESDSVIWKLYYDGLLEITGSGAMADYNGTTTPWYEYSAEIQKVSIKGNITHIGAMAFHSCSFQSIELPDVLRSIGMEAFAYCRRLKFMKIPAKVKELGTNSFRGCDSLSRVLFMTEGEECQIGLSVFRDVGKDCAFYISNELFAQKIKRGYGGCTVKKVVHYEKKTIVSQTNVPVMVQACLYEDGVLVVGNSEQMEIRKEQDWFFGKEEFEGDCVTMLFLDGAISRLGEGSFQKLSALKEVVITGAVEKIEEKAFGINVSDISFYTKNEMSERTLKYAGIRKVSREKW
ncbi:MAG: leucine-rich repeat domain-containing protein [Roseburia sp.]|nr:leucine-rich repeat domain-containing protein [Roseburia sp.]MCM1278117.1 leucine-rich repeat domain-containing protein [Robinsoniella sp.]